MKRPARLFFAIFFFCEFGSMCLRSLQTYQLEFGLLCQAQIFLVSKEGLWPKLQDMKDQIEVDTLDLGHPLPKPPKNSEK